MMAEPGLLRITDLI